MAEVHFMKEALHCHWPVTLARKAIRPVTSRIKKGLNFLKIYNWQIFISFQGQFRMKQMFAIGLKPTLT